MSTLVLLGAGASKDAKVPVATEMCSRFVEEFRQREAKILEKVLLFVLGGLALKRGMRGEDPAQAPNVEEVFAAIQMISKRHELEAAPFVSSWHPHIDDLEGIIYRQDLTRILEDTARSRGDVKNSEFNFFNRPPSRSEIERTLDGLTSPARQKSAFAQTNETMLHLLSSMVWIGDPERVAYLRPLVRWVADNNNASLATLNYDNGVEMAAKSEGVSVSLCIENWNACHALSEPADGSIEYLKLHGSVDWFAKPDDGELEIMDPKKAYGSIFRPLLVFGGGNKLRPDGPFLDLFDRFRKRVRESSTIGIIGYSFSDEHVNIPIRRWYRGSENRRLIILGGPGFSSKQASGLPTTNPSRITVLAKAASEGMREFIQLLAQDKG